MVVSAPEVLDDGEAAVPAPATYLGPLLERPGPDAGWEPPAGDAPLIVVSIGTAATDPAPEAALRTSILDAVADLDVRVLLTVADYVDRSEVTAPANTTVAGYIRHAAVLPHADLLVTHGGLGTVCAGLAHGVRMVCLPLDREQPENSAAVERIGAGVQLTATAPAEEIRAAVAAGLASGPGVRIEPDPAGAAAAVMAVAG